MNNPSLVRFLDGLGDLDGDLQSLGYGNRASCNPRR